MHSAFKSLLSCNDFKNKKKGKCYAVEKQNKLTAEFSQLWKSRHGELASKSLNFFPYLFRFHLVLLTFGKQVLELLQSSLGVHARLDLNGELNT